MRLIIILTCVASLATACGGSRAANDGRKQVVAGFYPLAFAASAIGGDRVDVTNLTPAGAEPHDLEVSPRQVEKVRSADLVLLLGRDFQPQLEDAAGSGSKVLRLLDTPGLRLLPNADPHVWLDPRRFALVVKRIAVALGTPGRANELVYRLRTLDSEYRSGLAHCARREIVTSHEAFAYLADRYGLRQIAITGISPEADPTPKALQNVIGVVRTSGATTVFFETLVSPRIAETVAGETGARTAVLDPIEGLTTAEESRGEDYLSIMEADLARLRSALGCR